MSEIAPQPAGAAAVVGGGNDRRHGGGPLQPAQDHRQAGAAAQADDARAGAAAARRRQLDLRRSSGINGIGAGYLPRLVQPVVDPAADLRRQAGHRLELLAGRREQRSAVAEVRISSALRGRVRRRAACRRASRPAAFARRWRWYPSAKRCASSRIRCSSCSAGRVARQQDRIASGPARRPPPPAWRAQTTATRGRSSSAIAASAAPSWPLPPSITTRFGAGGEAGVVAVRRRPSSSARTAGATASCIDREVVLPARRGAMPNLR